MINIPPNIANGLLFSNDHESSPTWNIYLVAETSLDLFSLKY